MNDKVEGNHPFEDISFKDIQMNDAFFAEYTPLVKRIAHHLINKLPSSVQVDDLIQAGMIGLIEAARKFDNSKGASFSTYAGIRIRGSMLDEVRKGDWTPRSVHRNNRMIARAVQEVENATGRTAKVQEVADKLGISLEEYHSLMHDNNGTRICAFEDLGLNEAVFTNTQASVHSSMMNPVDGIQQADFTSNLAAELARLPDREKLVVALYYDEELNLREVGQILGVSESRVSQIHSQAMLRLQGRMQAWKT